MDIRLALIRLGKSQAAIAATCEVSRQAINDVIRRKRNNPRLRQAVAKALGRPYSEVWGESDGSVSNSGVTDTSSNQTAQGAA